MKYVLNGVETNNKGAEIMLYAILQEIERRDKDAVVYLCNINHCIWGHPMNEYSRYKKSFDGLILKSLCNSYVISGSVYYDSCYFERLKKN